ncbi:MAG: ribosome maturation factor RimP, partial [Oscillospiraceae bacterium]|nr:ribosome maturation factor RimP [Oscillospiraceae bacterium]
TEQKIYDLVFPVVSSLGYLIWDVRFEKKGADWELTVFIDKETDGITIDDCEKVTTPVNDLLDEHDPIPQSYRLSISSPGLEADLIRESHFDACVGCEVRVRGIRNFDDGSREVVGILTDWNKDSVTIRTAQESEQSVILPFSGIAFVKLYFEF